jgi:hypothetical protein
MPLLMAPPPFGTTFIVIHADLMPPYRRLHFQRHHSESIAVDIFHAAIQSR